MQSDSGSVSLCRAVLGIEILPTWEVYASNLIASSLPLRSKPLSSQSVQRHIKQDSLGDCAKRLSHFDAFLMVWTHCFVHAHRDKTDEATRIIGLMLECVWPSASTLIPLTH